ncbi:MAG TPA: UDP-N-acetylmuramoyl-L-alanyl-D-glutamate--2,6-diaminopimelate ligase [Candidatus Krumholzibacteria bacterium]|nr:UDP-N-acetylmuramoyl-L-alanyl-D-glutamate--2,6-diaminopimelate ligase [Candidatus Krumholzibacteria bacterium]
MMTTERNTVTLQSLIDALGALVVTPLDGAVRDVPVTGVTVDSRAVEGGELFVAVRGTAVDGHKFVRDAVERGAAAVVIVEAEAARTPVLGVPFVVVKDSSKALALVAARFYGNPADALRLCGVTGTNGKTSTTHLVRAILGAEGMKTGLIGTLGHGIGTLVKDPHTTPDAVTLHAWLRRMLDEGCVGVVMEVSSHAVRQHRVWGLDFEVGMLTNVTHDHLDYHSSMEDYKAAKAEFCYSLNAAGRKKADGTLVYWSDDPNAREIGSRFTGRRIAVGTTNDADWRVHHVEVSLDGTRFSLELPDGERADVAMKLRGAFVPANAALAAAGAHAMGASLASVRAGLEAVDRVPGRFEALGGGDRPVVIIDYAHTPDGFERVLGTCRSLHPKRIITVFGCGGDRDKTKRPIMGELAQRMSTRVYLTTDNPRSERVEDIIADIRRGMQDQNVVVELDRERAIRAAINESKPGDLVALLGKGHEDYQIIGAGKLPWSDRRAAEEGLSQWRSQ